MTPAELPATWRERAQGLAPYAPAAAAAFASAAGELDQALRQLEADALTLEEASQVSGYSADHLGKLVKEGTIPNVGRKHSPRILRRDLPRKPRPPEPSAPTDGPRTGPSLARITRDAISTRTRRR